MKVIALRNCCIASGACVLAASQAFTQRESDGVVEILQERPSLELLKKVQQAVAACPSQVFVVEQPEQLANAIEEILRVTPIGEGRPRITREPVQLGETTIPAGEVLFLVLHAANHNSSVFPEAREIRFDREMQPILSFGRGIHACLGQQIARMELQVLWQTLLTRLPNVHLAVAPSEVPWRENETLTFGPAHLPVTW